MATATSAQEVSASDGQVLYRYGPSPERMDERLIIDVATATTTGTTDRAPWVGGWLRNQHRTTGQWPERASIAT